MTSPGTFGSTSIRPPARASSAGGGTEVDERTSTKTPAPTTDEGDHDRFAHYVIGGGEAITRSVVTGEPVVALCGKVWVPSRDPTKYPVCPECKRIKEELGW